MCTNIFKQKNSPILKKICILSSIIIFTISFLGYIPAEGINNPIEEQVAFTNPQYAAQLDGENYLSDYTTNSNSSTNNLKLECATPKELQDNVRISMISRTTDFSIKYTGDYAKKVLSANTFKEFMNNVFSYDDPSTSADYDYLRISWTNAKMTMQAYPSYTLYKFSFSYITTADQEEIVNKKTQEILTSLNVSNLSNYEKVKAVHDYIIKNVTYDKTLEDKSAYDALSKGSTICRGYALLAYDMLDKLSVPVRIISGKGNGSAHVWNLVEIDGAWYDLDVTWDDSTGSNSFFLKTEKDFSLHQRDVELVLKTLI